MEDPRDPTVCPKCGGNYMPGRCRDCGYMTPDDYANAIDRARDLDKERRMFDQPFEERLTKALDAILEGYDFAPGAGEKFRCQACGETKETKGETPRCCKNRPMRKVSSPKKRREFWKKQEA